MKLDKRSKETVSLWLIYGACASGLFAAVGWIGTDIWLASTQWLLVTVVLALFAVYLKLG